MSTNLSPVGGAAAQFLDNNGNPLSGGKIYTYEAGTTTPEPTYTTIVGDVPHSNPIVLDSAGRVPGGQIWVNASQDYKFVLTTSADVTIATYDDLTGINGTGLATNAVNVAYDPPGLGAVQTNVQAKLRETVSVKDFGAVGDGIANDTDAIQAAIDSGAGAIFYPTGTYLVSANINLVSNQTHYAYNDAVLDGGASKTYEFYIPVGGTEIVFDGLEFTRFDRTISHTADVGQTPASYITIRNCYFHNCNQGIYLPWFVNHVWIQNNRFKDITFAGSTSAIQIGKQESGRFADIFSQGPYYISENNIDTVTNTTSVASDTHGIIVRGYSAFIVNNNIKNITFGASSGTGCEGIYVVTWYSKILGNTLYNAGNREASIVLKGGSDDGVIPTGSFGFSNIISNNTLYYDNALNDDASAIYNQCDYTLISNNIISGFGDSAIKSTSNGNNNEIIGNYIQKFTGDVVFNISDSFSNITGNLIKKPIGKSASFYTFFITSASEEVKSSFIKNNHTVLDDDFVGTVFYNVYLNAISNAMSNVMTDTNFTTTNTTATIRAFTTAISSSLSNVYFGGRCAGTFTELVRFASGGAPTNTTISIYNQNDGRTVVGSTDIARGESGNTFTNSGASATVTALLPASIPNLSFTFIRTASFDLRIDPNGTDTIRGGGAGKYLSLDSDGASVTLRCVSAGTWEIVASHGTISYEL